MSHACLRLPVAVTKLENGLLQGIILSREKYNEYCEQGRIAHNLPLNKDKPNGLVCELIRCPVLVDP
jgi:hypothetical protein